MDEVEIQSSTYKMVVLGHFSVGKSSIVLNFVKNEFNPRQESTIGASFLAKTIFNNRNAIKFEIWDTAGQERYYSLIPMYYRGAHVALIVFDVTSLESFEIAKKWVDELKYDKPKEFLKILVGNKADMIEETVVKPEMCLEYANKEKIRYYETSAKTGEGIQKLFTEVAQILPIHTKKVDEISAIRKAKKDLFCC